MTIHGVSGDAGRWGDRYSKTPADVEQKRAEAANKAPRAFDVALRYGASPTPTPAPVDVPSADRTADALDRLATAQRNAVLNRNAAAPAETSAPAEPTAMAPQPLSADELAHRRALDAIAAYKRNSPPS